LIAFFLLLLFKISYEAKATDINNPQKTSKILIRIDGFSDKKSRKSCKEKIENILIKRL
tara:strand:- start:622 stop:798 length:177 start_codon:yes stop_codon:yes gene_type:complete